MVSGVELPFRYAWHGDQLWLHTPRGDYAFESRRRHPMQSAEAQAAHADTLRAGMNGRVVEVGAAGGQQVRKGERLVVIEAMKMEHVLGSPRDGEVESVEISVGDQVVPGQVLLRLKREP